jgi:L-alanine-DL-glutamate epimerase-like enolase superfamily enzyme
MKISQLRFLQVKGTYLHDGLVNIAGFAVPMSIYPDRKADDGTDIFRTPGEKIPMEAIFLIIETDDGVNGMFGPITLDLARFIHERLANNLIGEDPHGIERIWDRMYRSNVSMLGARLMFAISAVDLALWDLKGKDIGVPVYKLLGGPTRSCVPAYASMVGYSNDPATAAELSRGVIAKGYKVIKWFFRHHPVDGEAGVRENIDLIRSVREAVGPDIEIIFDAWNSWDVPYTLRMAELAEPYRVSFFEAPIRPDMLWQFVELRKSIGSTRISGGEHAYGRWAVKEMLEAGGVDILQPDPRWVGGISEMIKVCALASAFGVDVMPHAGGLATTHIIASQSIGLCPIQEHALRDAHTVHYFLKDKSVAVDGYIPLPAAPGLGLELDETTVESRAELKL